MTNILLSTYDFSVFDECKNLLQPTFKVVVVPLSYKKNLISNNETWESFIGEGTYERKIIYDPFNNCGIYDIDILNRYTMTSELMNQHIQEADVLFLTGGCPIEFKNNIEECGLTDNIKNFKGIIMGASAGAMVQSGDYVIWKCDEYDYFSYESGLGLVDYALIVHYTEASEQIEAIHMGIEKTDVVTIDDNSCMIVYNDKEYKLLGTSKLWKKNK